MDQGHDDAASAGATGGNSGNNSAEQFQPEPQAPQISDLGAGASAPTQPADSPQLNAASQTTPQGIFSSPDLAVNSENLEDIKPELSNENKSRIASAFAMTDATQKHDQLADQMASQDQDAVSGTVLPAGAGGFGSNSTASTATGDIRMPGVKKKSKLPLILLALVVLAAIGGGVVAWMLLGESKTPVVLTAKEAFASYRDYLENGPENLRNDEREPEAGNYFLYQVSNSGIITEKQLSEYLIELGKKYDTFSGLAAESNDLNVNLDQYGRMLELLVVNASLRELKQNLLNKYVDSGANVAYNYIFEVVPKQPDDEEYYAMKKISSALEAFLNDELDLIEVYDNLGCISDHKISATCGHEDDHDNGLIMELQAKQSSEQDSIVSYSAVLRPIFTAQTERIAQTMETR